MLDSADLPMSSPWLNAAGSLGFHPRRSWNWPHAQGAFVTNPVSLRPRQPAPSRAALSYAGGVLLHSGLPNPGLKAVLRANRERWRRAGLPVWVHCLASTPEEADTMVRMLEEIDEVAAVELGLPPQAGPAERLEMVRAAAGELPLVVCVPLNAAGEEWVGRLAGAGASGLCLSAPRGSLFDRHGQMHTGRLVGPALLPQTLAAVLRLGGQSLPLLAAAGVTRLQDGEALLAAGAAAVQLDTLLW